MSGSAAGTESRMELVIKPFSGLSTAELYEILRLREAVFIVEQNCPYPEADGQDYDAVHLFYAEGYAGDGRGPGAGLGSGSCPGRVKAYLRLFWKPGEPGTVQVGRVVNAPDVRGTGLGRRILQEGVRYATETMGATRLCLHAQVQASGFYAKEGFEVSSGVFLEDDIPHVEMRLG